MSLCGIEVPVKLKLVVDPCGLLYRPHAPCSFVMTTCTMKAFCATVLQVSVVAACINAYSVL